MVRHCTGVQGDGTAGRLTSRPMCLKACSTAAHTPAQSSKKMMYRDLPARQLQDRSLSLTLLICRLQRCEARPNYSPRCSAQLQV